MDKINEIVNVLNHKGPDLFDLISNSWKNHKEYDIKFNSRNKTTIVTITGEEAYSLKLEDIYIFNEKHELIKQILKLDEKSEVIFDKFEIAKKLVSELTSNSAALAIANFN